jgi:hypothetical protein
VDKRYGKCIEVLVRELSSSNPRYQPAIFRNLEATMSILERHVEPAYAAMATYLEAEINLSTGAEDIQPLKEKFSTVKAAERSVGEILEFLKDVEKRLRSLPVLALRVDEPTEPDVPIGEKVWPSGIF